MKKISTVYQHIKLEISLLFMLLLLHLKSIILIFKNIKS